MSHIFLTDNFSMKKRFFIVGYFLCSFTTHRWTKEKKNNFTVTLDPCLCHVVNDSIVYGNNSQVKRKTTNEIECRRGMTGTQSRNSTALAVK